MQVDKMSFIRDGFTAGSALAGHIKAGDQGGSGNTQETSR